MNYFGKAVDYGLRGGRKLPKFSRPGKGKTMPVLKCMRWPVKNDINITNHGEFFYGCKVYKNCYNRKYEQVDKIKKDIEKYPVSNPNLFQANVKGNTVKSNFGGIRKKKSGDQHIHHGNESIEAGSTEISPVEDGNDVEKAPVEDGDDVVASEKGWLSKVKDYVHDVLFRSD